MGGDVVIIRSGPVAVVPPGWIPPNPRARRFVYPRRTGGGMGDARNYCRSNPPDAATVAILAARGDTVNLIDCASGDVPAPAVGPAPVFNPAYPGEEDCAALGLATSAGRACVQRNTARSVANENAFLQSNRDYQTRLCISNNGGGWVPPGVDIATWCAANYGGSQGSVPASAPTGPAVFVPPAPAPAPVSVPGPLPPASVSSSNAGPMYSPVSRPAVASGGFDLSSIADSLQGSGWFGFRWWAWLAGGAAALWMFGGKR